MALNGYDLDLLLWLKQQGHIRQGCSVIDLGRQQLSDSFLDCRTALETMQRLFGVARPCPLPPPSAPVIDEELKHLDSTAPAARDFWTWLGVEYSVIDIDGTSGTILLDLNYDNVPADAKGKYGLVMNFGTTEHVANQLNAFRVVHDLTAVGGVMFHNVPAQGMVNHGLVNYHPKFFWMLARSNGYKWLATDFSQSGSMREFSVEMIHPTPETIVPGLAARVKGYSPPNGSLAVLLQKVIDLEYVAPLDVEKATTNLQVLQERYWTVFNPDALIRLVEKSEPPSESSRDQTSD
jgi:hypothetical protein